MSEEKERKNKKQFIDKDGIVRRYCAQCGRALPLNLFYNLTKKSKDNKVKVYKFSRCKQCYTLNLRDKRRQQAREARGTHTPVTE